MGWMSAICDALRKETLLWPEEWGSICCSSVRSPTPSHSKTLSNLFEPFQIKWEVYFSKELCRSSLLCRRYDSACRCIMWLFNKWRGTSHSWNLPDWIFMKFFGVISRTLVGWVESYHFEEMQSVYSTAPDNWTREKERERERERERA